MRQKILHCILILVVMPLSGWCQWSSDPNINTPIPGFTETFQTVVVSDGADGAIVASYTDQDINHVNIIVQKIDSYGNIQWGSVGITLTSTAISYFDLVPDGAGGCIVVWLNRTTIDTLDVHAQRVGSDGTIMWNAGGITIVDGVVEHLTEIIPDGNSGAIISWVQGSGGMTDILAQRINGDGTPLWNPEGVVICNAPNAQRGIQMDSDDNGGVAIVWVDERDITTSKIYAQRIDASGSVLWDANGILVADSMLSFGDSYTFIPEIVFNGIDGFVVGWTDSAIEPVVNLYCQKITLDGAFAWNPAGVQVFADMDYSYTLHMDSDNAGNCFFQLPLGT